VSQKSDRRQACEAGTAYHEAKLTLLIAHVAEAIDGFRSGELGAFDVDEVLFQYSRAAKELWKFCNIGNAQVTAGQLYEGPPIDWWERGAPKRARRPANELPTGESVDSQVVERASIRRVRPPQMEAAASKR
jgi:hypothetical protein